MHRIIFIKWFVRIHAERGSIDRSVLIKCNDISLDYQINTCGTKLTSRAYQSFRYIETDNTACSHDCWPLAMNF